MDAFYASVEQRDRPELLGRPVIVGADPGGRGVVAAASYEARRFGVHSAMPIGQAKRRCPNAVFLPVNIAKYAEVSAEIMAILGGYSPVVEPLSLDEAFLDASGTERLFGPPIEIARTIKRHVREDVGLTASAGVAPNKLLAKIASALKKPDGLVEVGIGEEESFLRGLPISRLWGVGKATETELRGMGIETIGRLAATPRELLERRFGKNGLLLHDLAHGRDPRPVEPFGRSKSVGAEETFQEDQRDSDRLRRTLLAQAGRVARELRETGCVGRTVTLKLRFAGFRTITRSHTAAPTQDDLEIYGRAVTLLDRVGPSEPVRLIGLSVSGIEDNGIRQLGLFGERAARGERLARAVDRLATRFGERALVRAALLERPEKD